MSSFPSQNTTGVPSQAASSPDWANSPQPLNTSGEFALPDERRLDLMFDPLEAGDDAWSADICDMLDSLLPVHSAGMDSRPPTTTTGMDSTPPTTTTAGASDAAQSVDVFFVDGVGDEKAKPRIRNGHTIPAADMKRFVGMPDACDLLWCTPKALRSCLLHKEYCIKAYFEGTLKKTTTAGKQRSREKSREKRLGNGKAKGKRGKGQGKAKGGKRQKSR